MFCEANSAFNVFFYKKKIVYIRGRFWIQYFVCVLISEHTNWEPCCHYQCLCKCQLSHWSESDNNANWTQFSLGLGMCCQINRILWMHTMFTKITNCGAANCSLFENHHSLIKLNKKLMHLRFDQLNMHSVPSNCSAFAVPRSEQTYIK